MRDEFFYRQFGDKEASLLATHNLRKNITENLLNKVEGKGNDDLKFILLLGHDNTISALLSAMDIDQDSHPIYAANLIFELWK